MTIIVLYAFQIFIGTMAGYAVSRGFDARHGVDFRLRHTAIPTARI